MWCLYWDFFESNYIIYKTNQRNHAIENTNTWMQCPIHYDALILYGNSPIYTPVTLEQTLRIPNPTKPFKDPLPTFRRTLWNVGFLFQIKSSDFRYYPYIDLLNLTCVFSKMFSMNNVLLVDLVYLYIIFQEKPSRNWKIHFIINS